MVSQTQELSYANKLKDPRWQRKRLEILQRDKWTCQRCGATKNTLHVHHRIYSPDKEPWEEDNSRLVTLCEWCHISEDSEGWADSLKTMIHALKDRMWAGLAHELACAIGLMEPSTVNTKEMHRIVCLISWLLANPEDRMWIQQASIERLKERGDKHTAWLLEEGGHDIGPFPPCRPQDFEKWLDLHFEEYYGHHSAASTRENP